MRIIFLSLYMEIKRFQDPGVSFDSHSHLIYLCAVPCRVKIVFTCLFLVAPNLRKHANISKVFHEDREQKDIRI